MANDMKAIGFLRKLALLEVSYQTAFIEKQVER
jgi:hypothetical protein